MALGGPLTYAMSRAPDPGPDPSITLAHPSAGWDTLRPHGSLKGLTPMEAYTRPDLKLDLRQAVGAARTQRMAANKQVNCSLCPPGTI